MRIAAVSIVTLGLLGLIASLFIRLDPPPASREVLARLEARFPETRPYLEGCVAYRHWLHHFMAIRDSLLAAGETTYVRRAERGLESPVVPSAPTWLQHTYGGWDGGPGSPIYVAAWARRGWGPSAPWASAGYVYFDGMKYDEHDGVVKHLDGDWYLYSLIDDEGDLKPARN